MPFVRLPAWILPALFVGAAAAQGQTIHRPPTPLGLDEYFYVPEDNELTPERIELGRALFFDTILSADRRVSCASCHRPERSFSDGRQVSRGVHGRRGSRNAPALVNRAYGRALFWDGRATRLEDQVLDPVQNPDELGLTLDELVRRLNADSSYLDRFERAYGGRPSAADAGRALASFVRVQRFGNAPIDRYQSGDMSALSADAQQGLRLFRGRANCTACHVGPNFSDEKLHNTGVSFGSRDLGAFLVTGRDEDRGGFKTPTLREVSRTAPYMHDGSLETLDDVIAFYDRGGRANPYLDEEIKPLEFTRDERRHLRAFLEALTSAR